MTGLAEFLIARLDEDEQLARDADSDWTATSPELPRGTHLVYGLERVGYGLKYQMFASVWEPARVLADIAAKRAIIEKYVDQNEGEHVPEYALREAVRQLAAVYASHPDYDESWRT